MLAIAGGIILAIIILVTAPYWISLILLSVVPLAGAVAGIAVGINAGMPDNSIVAMAALGFLVGCFLDYVWFFKDA